jgi:hypothetical protein
MAARITAAAAVLGDYQSESTSADVAEHAMWGARLADMLAYLLAELPASTPAVATRLDQIATAGREVLDDELTGRQTALEQLVLEVEQLSEELGTR